MKIFNFFAVFLLATLCSSCSSKLSPEAQQIDGKWDMIYKNEQRTQKVSFYVPTFEFDVSHSIFSATLFCSKITGKLNFSEKDKGIRFSDIEKQKSGACDSYTNYQDSLFINQLKTNHYKYEFTGNSLLLNDAGNQQGFELGRYKF